MEEGGRRRYEDIPIHYGRNKRAVEDHFDHCVEVENNLQAKGKEKELQMLREISEMADIYYVRQKEPRRLGHAIYCARKYVRDKPFAVLLGDDIVNSSVPCIRQLMDIHDARAFGVGAAADWSQGINTALLWGGDR